MSIKSDKWIRRMAADHGMGTASGGFLGGSGKGPGLLSMAPPSMPKPNTLPKPKMNKMKGTKH